MPALAWQSRDARGASASRTVGLDARLRSESTACVSCVIAAAVTALPCSGKGHFPSDLSFDADGWLKFFDLVSKADVKKIGTIILLVYVFL